MVEKRREREREVQIVPAFVFWIMIFRVFVAIIVLCEDIMEDVRTKTDAGLERYVFQVE